MLIWLAALMVGCNPMGPPTNGSPAVGSHNFVVDPSIGLRFGDVSVGDTPVKQTIELTNVGESSHYALFEIVDASGEPDVFTIGGDNIIFSVGPQERFSVDVFFEPALDREYSAALRVNTDDLVLPITGSGVAPMLSVTAPNIGATMQLGCEASFPITVQNVGRQTAVVQDVAWTHPDVFSLNVPPGFSLIPGEVRELLMTFGPVFALPDEEGGWGTEVSISSDALGSPNRLPIWLFGEQDHPEQVDVFAVNPPLEMDLLIVADTAGAMGTNIASQLTDDVIDELTESLTSRNVNFNVAVLSGASICPQTGAAYLNSATSTREMLRGHIRDGVSGTAGAGSSQLMVHALDALDAECLETFQRQDALLHVLLLAGQDDDSGQDVTDQIAMLEDIAPGGLMISSLANQEDVPCWGLSPVTRYRQAVDQTGGADTSACDNANWSAAMNAIARQSASVAVGPLAVTLQNVLAPTVRVEVREPGDVDFVPFDAWTLSPDQDDYTLTVEAIDAPLSNSVLRVSYLNQVGCPTIAD